MMERTRNVVRERVAGIMPELRPYREAPARQTRGGLHGRRVQSLLAGPFAADAGHEDGPGRVTDGQPGRLPVAERTVRRRHGPGRRHESAGTGQVVQEQDVDLFIGGVKERPIAYKLGIGFCDHNHERKECLAGFEGMLNFAREVHATVMSPVWQFVSRQRNRQPTAPVASSPSACAGECSACSVACGESQEDVVALSAKEPK